jgi:hypothetical protein
VADGNDEGTVQLELDAGSGGSGYERAPDGALRWPAPDRDSPQIGQFDGRLLPDAKLEIMLSMEGKNGRDEDAVLKQTGKQLSRPRRWHKLLERMGVLYPGVGNTRLGRLGRILKDASSSNGLKTVIAREAREVLKRYQFDNPIEKSLPQGDSVHPYYAVLKAASELENKLHWDELNRELMRVRRDQDLDETISKIRKARGNADYANFIGKASNAAGLLNERTHPAEATAPEGKSPEGQLRDQRMTPFLKRAGFGELLLQSAGIGGGGYWTIPAEMQALVTEAIRHPPPEKRFSTEQEWIEWFCEGAIPNTQTQQHIETPSIVLPLAQLTVDALKVALAKYEPDLRFTNELLSSLVASIRSGDGKSFTILRGVSGTGKSRLVAALARCIYGSAAIDRPFLTIIEVRPDWTDGSPLLGHYDLVAGKYVREPFLDALLAAETTDAPIFICLDEMNLARVEYYLAECLSAMESGNPITLDTRDDGSVGKRVAWQSNLFLFGTINVDESTLRLSDKVLDRAQVIDTSDIDLMGAVDTWLDKSALDQASRKLVRDILGGCWSLLREMDAHFGYRSAKAAVRFIDEALSSGTLTITNAIDNQLCQKVLVKLRGEGEHWNGILSKLDHLFQSLGPDAVSLKTVRRMRADLDRLGSFQFWN